MASKTFKGVTIDSADAFAEAVALATSQNSETHAGESGTYQWRGGNSALIAVNPAVSPAADKDTFLVHPGNTIYAAAIAAVYVKGRGVLVLHVDELA
jgi:hypothetical protein